MSPASPRGSQMTNLLKFEGAFVVLNRNIRLSKWCTVHGWTPSTSKREEYRHHNFYFGGDQQDYPECSKIQVRNFLVIARKGIISIFLFIECEVKIKFLFALEVFSFLFVKNGYVQKSHRHSLTYLLFITDNKSRKEILFKCESQLITGA